MVLGEGREQADVPLRQGLPVHDRLLLLGESPLELDGHLRERGLRGLVPLILGRLLPGQLLLAQDGAGAMVRDASQDDVGPAAGHVGGDGHGAEATRLGDDLGLPLVVFRVEDHVLDAGLLQERGQVFRFLDGDGAHEDGAPRGVELADLVEHGAELLPLGAVHHVRVLDPDEGPVRGDRQHVELVDLVELRGLGFGRARHPRELLVHPEEVLERDRGEGLVLALDLDLLLGLHGLMEAVGPPATRHEAPGELVHDHDLAVVHHVVDVPLEEGVGAQALVDVVEHVHVRGVVEVLDAQEALGVGHPLFRQGHRLGLLVDDEVPRLLELRALLGLLLSRDPRSRLQLGDDAVDPVVLVGRLLGRAADDEGRARLVDEDRVHLVHHREVMAPLDVAPEVELHVVAEVVEAQLVVGAVRDVGAVGVLALLVPHGVLDHADREAQEAIEASHPFAVAARQVVVDRDDVDPLALERVEIRREGRHEGLAFAGLHLGDRAAVQGDAADELHVEMAHPEHAPARLPHDGKGFGEEAVEGLAPASSRRPQAPAELGRLLAQLVVGELLERGLQLPDPLDRGAGGA